MRVSTINSPWSRGVQMNRLDDLFLNQSGEQKAFFIINELI